MGVLWLSTIPLTSGVVMAQFGTRHAGSLFGIVFLSHQVGSFVGSWGAGLVRDAMGSYDAWWWTLACYKLGIILEGTNARAAAGRAPVETGRDLHQRAVLLFEQAGHLIDGAGR
jgi:predicted MFS family arabinose efflux permease